MIKISSKQDRGVFSRTPLDTERKYGKKIEKTNEKVETLENDFVIDDYLSVSSSHVVQNRVITQALANKVNSVDGKDLSTNDFTNAYKNELDNLAGISSTVIYNNSSGTEDDITLTRSVVAFDYIDIFYGDSFGNYDTKRIYNADGKSVGLQINTCGINGYTSKTQMYTISDNFLSAGNFNEFSIDSVGNVTIAQVTDKLKIHKVIGYTN